MNRAASPSRARRVLGSRPALLGGFFLLAAVVASAPAVLHVHSAFIADDDPPGFGEPTAGDHLQATYRFWLVGHQLARGAAPWLDPYSFRPLVEPQTVLMGWPWGLPFWPLHLAAGPVIAWNLLLLASIALAGLATYGWLRALRLPTAAALAGGLAFAIAPYRLAQSGGHLLGWAALFVPACLWAFERSCAAETSRARHLWGGLAAVLLLSVPLCGQVHLALAALPFCLLYALVRRRLTATLWLAGGAVAGALVGLWINATIIGDSIASQGRTIAQVELFQSDWLDLVSRTRREGLEQFAFTGWLLPLAAVVGLAVLLRHRRVWLAALLLVAVVVPLLAAVGTNLPGYEQLRDALPPLRYTRVPGRWLPLANLALAVLGAVAVAHVLARARPDIRRALGFAAVLLVAADLLVFPFGRNDAAPASEAYAALAPSAGRLLELPYFTPGTHFGSSYDFYALRVPRERPNGYSTLAPAGAYGPSARLRRLNCGIWLPDDQAQLAALGVTDVIYHRGLYDQARIRTAWFGWHGLQLAGYRTDAPGAGPAWHFARRGDLPAREAPVPEPDRQQPVLCDGWRGFDTTQPLAGLWIHGEGTVALGLAAEPTPATIWVDGAVTQAVQLDAETSVELDLVGDRWHAIVIETRPATSTTGVPLRLSGFRLPP